jgi:hypothetical protein
VMHQAGGMVAAGEPPSGAVGRMLTTHAGLGLNLPAGGMQGQQGDTPGW